MKGIVFLLASISFFYCRSQFIDDFSDDDFTVDPVWSGDTSEYLVIDNQLNSNGPDTGGTLYLSTPSLAIIDAEWQFLVKLEFPPSGSNRARIYLISDHADLESGLNGYFIEIGQSREDQIKFYRQDGEVEELLFGGSTLFSDDVMVRIKVTRDHAGQWAISSDSLGGDSFNSEGPPFTDDTYKSSSFFGVVCFHTSNRRDLFFFDDFVVTGTGFVDNDPPMISSVDIFSDDSLIVNFTESIEQVSAETTSNYSVNNGIGNPSVASLLENESSVALNFPVPFIDQVENMITINGVKDLFENVISNENTMFTYVSPFIPTFRDVVINEIMPDPPGSTTGNVPTVEYAELFNASDQSINLEGWVLEGVTSTGQSLPYFLLAPQSYVILTSSVNVSEFFGMDVITWGGSNPSVLRNDGETVSLKNQNGVLVDYFIYDRSSDGISIEQINPNLSFFLPSNYSSSTNPDGGTPGARNSIFDETPDTMAPSIVIVEVISSTELVIEFDEILEESTANTVASYSVDEGIDVLSVALINSFKVSLIVSELPLAQVRALTINGVQDLFGNATLNLTVEFEYIETQSAEVGDILINEFLASPTNESLLPNTEFVELYNKSNKFVNLESWILSDRVNDSKELDFYVLRPNSYVILTGEGNKMLFETYGEILEVSDFPSLNNSGDDIMIKDSTGRKISSVTYNSSSEGISSELVNPYDPCISFNSFSSSIDEIGGTPGQVNSVFDETPDKIPPAVTSFGYLNSLVVNFSEVMDGAALSNNLHYSSSDLSIDQVIVTGDFPTSVELTFLEEIILGRQYEITISGLIDCAGNQMNPTLISFGFGRSPLFNELIFTEILFDEDPAVGLPEREYFEIYNTTEEVITTLGLSLIDATSTIDLPATNLNPGEYYVFTSISGAAEFDTNAVGVSGFPSLNNSGELLVISHGDDLIASLAYKPHWHDEETSDGGYALELTDVTNPCLENANNWRSSKDPNGGTPGEVNSISSVIPDHFGPEIINVTAISSDTIKIDFSEKIDPSSALSAHVDIQPSLNIDRLFVHLNEPRTLFAILKNDLEVNQLYSMNITHVFDCSSNEVQPNDIVFALPLEAASDEIKLSEVLFNPRSSGVDFVEIFNDSKNYISLKNWKLARITDDGISDEKTITSEELVIDPREYVVFTTNSNVLLSSYPKGQQSQFVEVPSLPTYPNDTGNVVLINAGGEIMERFFYDEDFHFDLLESVDGVSLERISFSNPTNQPNNWRSASSVEGFATPGYANSQALAIEPAAAKVEVNPKVFIPGNAGSGRDFTTINYQFDSPGQFANVNIYDQNGRLVRNLTNGELLSTSGFLRWDGETNDGSMARLGYYVILFEVYNAAGNTEIIKETVAIGRDF